MKVFALAATAAASQTEWMLNTWWEEAQNVFNFASGNYAQWQQVIFYTDEFFFHSENRGAPSQPP